MSRHSKKNPREWDEYVVLFVIAILLGIIIQLVRILP